MSVKSYGEHGVLTFADMRRLVDVRRMARIIDIWRMVSQEQP
jgi:hypothetical protein